MKISRFSTISTLVFFRMNILLGENSRINRIENNFKAKPVNPKPVPLLYETVKSYQFDFAERNAWYYKKPLNICVQKWVKRNQHLGNHKKLILLTMERRRNLKLVPLKTVKYVRSFSHIKKS